MLNATETAYVGQCREIAEDWKNARCVRILPSFPPSYAKELGLMLGDDFEMPLDSHGWREREIELSMFGVTTTSMMGPVMTKNRSGSSLMNPLELYSEPDMAISSALIYAKKSRRTNTPIHFEEVRARGVHGYFGEDGMFVVTGLDPNIEHREKVPGAYCYLAADIALLYSGILGKWARKKLYNQ